MLNIENISSLSFLHNPTLNPLLRVYHKNDKVAAWLQDTRKIIGDLKVHTQASRIAFKLQPHIQDKRFQL